MKPANQGRSFVALLLVAATFFSASCASPAPKSAREKDYDEVYETGSNLPKRVPKKHTDDAASASQTQTVSADALNNQDHSAFKPPAGVSR